MDIQLIKVHGSGNTFFLLDTTKLPHQLTESEIVTLTQKLTDHENGLLGGADGLLLVGDSQKNDAVGRMRVINADGSEASMCGNGLRTVARYLAQKNHAENFEVETMYQNLHVQKAQDLFTGVSAFKVEISPVSFAAQDLKMHFKAKEQVIDEVLPELSDTLKFTAIAVPNPHLISFVDEVTLQGPELERIAAYLNGENPYFPEGVNVSFVNLRAKDEIFVRTYERGVGFTNACGTAMSASSLLTAYLHPEYANFNDTLSVYNPGGMVKTVPHEDGNHYWIDLIGNATFQDYITLDLKAALMQDFTDIKIQKTSEQKQYLQFIQKVTK
ncbi:diaminopimelate epimerase [Lactobacillus sp. CC-MHH1034]|uniref:diaminopimelate epimerase n=1 Tax=Agrilactobacillus fermenti TaxID=2586909 RepID=UPI001E374129|nr:diaminopimelate epimerase [Agrilactobacillus fermenti]MCD2255303.1 diaminopimelate epimerase [Agrilactobacillus fermenti]